MKALFALALLSLTTSLSAEILESNVTFQVKAYFQNSPVNQGNFSVLKPDVVTLKTSDIIRFYNDQNNGNFSNKARIIYRVVVTSNGTTNGYFIQEKNKPELEVSSDFGFLTNVAVSTYKLAPNGTGTSTFRGGGDAKFEIDGSNEFFSLNGSLNLTTRIILSKQVTGASLELRSGSQTGIGSAKLRRNLIIQDSVTEGVFKISPPKVIKAL